MGSIAQHPKSPADQFLKHWCSSTSDNNLTLHGFRRFKTTHLLNLRFLEGEIAELDHTIYQAGLSLGLDPTSTDRLGLKHSKKDEHVPAAEETISRELVLRLRDLLKQYDEALAAFNGIMAMETFSLLDDEMHSSLHSELTLHEIYNTRLVRADLGPRSRQDPFQRLLHKSLRAFRYWKMSRSQDDRERPGTFSPRHRWSYQNTIRVAEIVARFIIALISGVFLIVPLAVMSYESRKDHQLVTVAAFVIVFSFLVSAMLKVSNLEMMMASAAYAAVLSVFFSNIPQTGS